MRDPLVLPALSIAAGILAARFADFAVAECVLVLVAASFLGILAKRRALRRAALFCVFVGCVAAGTLAAVLHRRGDPPRLNAESGEELVLEGCIVEPPTAADDREQFVLELAPHARARVSVYGDNPPNLRYGQRVEVPARVRKPRNYQNAGAFDYVRYLARRDTYWTASAQASAVRLLPAQCGTRFEAWVFGLRTAALDRIEKLYAGDEYKTALLSALLLGESSRVQRVWTDHYRRTGTYHAIVISGLHIAVVAGAILFLRRCTPLPPVVVFTAAALVAWLYAFVAGCDPPVLRSAAGFTLFLIAHLFYRRGRVLNLLAFVAILFLLADPEQLTEASFQLSFLAVAAIAVFATPVLERTSGVLSHAASGLASSRDFDTDQASGPVRVELKLAAETLALYTRMHERRALQAISVSCRAGCLVWDSLIVSLAVQFGLALPMVIWFHRLSVTGLSANLVIVPLLTLAVPAGFVAILTGWTVPASIAGGLLEASRAVAGWHAKWEPSWRFADPPMYACLLWVAAIAMLACAFRRRIAAALLVAAAVLLVWRPFDGPAPRRLELTAVDVGQGEALLVGFPDGKRMLVDGGGIAAYGGRRRPRIDIGEDVVSPYLWSRGITHVDVVVSTHAHEDHAGGLPALSANFAPAEVWTGAGAVPEGLHLPARRLHAPARFAWGGADIEVLSPGPDYTPRASAANNDSLVLLVSYGRHRFLLTGDAEKQMEWAMLDGGRLPRLDVLKIAHHGSRTSTTADFAAATKPSVGLVSAGAENPYHLPHREVLERLSGATVLRTDMLGRSTVWSDGARLGIDAEQWHPSTAGQIAPFSR